jgi:hypothetical protein
MTYSVIFIGKGIIGRINGLDRLRLLCVPVHSSENALKIEIYSDFSIMYDG